MDARGVAELLLDAKALAFNVREPFTYASGIRSPVYVDCRLLISDVERRDIVVDSLADIVDGLDADVVAATASAGIPWGAWVADRLGMPLVYVRQSQKNHGKGKCVEGSAPEGSKAVVVEDLVSTGGSSIHTVESLRGEGVGVEHCTAIFTYGLRESEDYFRAAEVALHSLSNLEAAIEAAVKRRYLTPEEATEAKDWAKDPNRWRT